MNQVLERANTTWEHLNFGLRRFRPAELEPEMDADDDLEFDDEPGSSLPLFIWGALTALALWWLYLRPATPERKLNTLRANRRPGPRPGSRPASASQAQRSEPTITPAMPAEGVEDDDLTQVYGIGPARAARLREAGITTFAALAVADAEQLRDILAGVGVETGAMDTWPEQASLAAKGDWDGLAAYHDRLRAERG